MTDETKPTTRRRRLKGAKLAKLRTLMKRLHRAQNVRDKAREDILDARDLFPDQVMWRDGRVFDAAIAVTDREVIGRLAPKQIAADRRNIREMERIDAEIGDLLWLCAERLGCMPHDIDVNSGEIKGGPVDVIDPDDDLAESDEPADDAEPVADQVEGPIPFPTKSA